MRFLSYNTMMIELPFVPIPVTRHSFVRMRTLPAQLLASKSDVIFLQEVFSQDLRRRLVNFFSKYGFHFTHHNNRHTLNVGHGLMILSRYPLIGEQSFTPYQSITRWEERFCTKGVLVAKALLPEIGPVLLINTHLGAIYWDKKTGAYNVGHVAAKREQIHQFLGVVQGQSSLPYIIGGDFNTHEFELPSQKQPRLDKDYQLLTTHIPIRDSFRELHPLSEGGGAALGWTYARSEDVGRRLDYLFLSKNFPATVVKSNMLYQNKIEPSVGPHFYLSDHYGVQVTLRLKM